MNAKMVFVRLNNMSTFYLECLYCGHCWNMVFYSYMSEEDVLCPKCKDKNVKKKENAAKGDYFGYNKGNKYE